MKYIVLSREERIILERDTQYYLDLGYPTEIAEQYAWDHYSVNARGVYVDA